MTEQRRRPPVRLFTALAVTTTFGFGLLVYTVGVMFVPMRAELGWSNAVLSAGPTIGLAVSGLAAPVVGRVVDDHGGRWIMVAGSIAGGLGVALWSISGTQLHYLAAWVVIGAGMAMSLYEPAFATVVRHVPEQRRHGVLAITLTGALASTIFLPVASWLVGLAGWRSALGMLAIGHVVVTVPLCLRWIPRVPAAPSSRSANPRAERSLPGFPTPTLATSPRLRRIVSASVLGGSANVSVGIHVVAFLIAAGVQASHAALIAALLGVAKVVGRLVVGAAARHRPGHVLVASCLCLMSASLLVGVGLPMTMGHVAMIVLFGAGAGGLTVAQPLLVAEQFGTKDYGVTAGRIHRVSSLFFSIAPFAVGALVTLTAGYVAAWLLLATGCVVAAWIVPRSSPRVHA